MSNIKLPTKFTYATAESITGGRLQSFFTEENGSSSYFIGGVTAYTTNAKVAILNVDEEVARESNSVCSKTARDMAIGCHKLFGADVSIATTGYVQEYIFNEVEYDPVVYIAVYIKNINTTEIGIQEEAIFQKRILLPKENDRESNILLATQYALSFVEHILK